MKSIRRAALVTFAFAAALLMGAASASAQTYYPGAQTSILPNFNYPAQTFTATGQTGAALGLSGVSYATIQVKGVGLTTATFAIQGSNDGGVTFYPLNTAAIATPATLALTQTATTSSLYIVNLAGLTNIRFVTSGTFTATSVAINLTATSNRGTL